MPGTNATPAGQAGALRLKEYWAHGKGREKWIHDPHPWTRLNQLLRAHGVSGRVVDGETENIYFMATGHHSASRKKGQRL